MKLRLREREGEGVCVYCHDRIGDMGRTCAGCGALVHFECWEELRRCPSIGCTETAPVGGGEDFVGPLPVPEQVCISCQAPMPLGQTGACNRCDAQHAARWGVGPRTTEDCIDCGRPLMPNRVGKCGVCRANDLETEAINREAAPFTQPAEGRARFGSRDTVVEPEHLDGYGSRIRRTEDPPPGFRGHLVRLLLFLAILCLFLAFIGFISGMFG